MKKSLMILMAFVITFFTVPFGGNAVLAEQDADRFVTPDQAHTMDYVVKEDGKDDKSVANQFFKKPATLLTKDGETYAQVRITNGDMVKELSTVNGDVVIVAENNDENSTVDVQFKVDSFEMDLEMRVIVPAMPGFPGYDQEHTANLVFDQDSEEEIEVGDLQLVTSEGENGPNSEESGDPEEGDDDESNVGEDNEDDQEDESDESFIDLETGFYTIEAAYLHADKEEPSSMSGYMDSNIFVNVQEDQIEATITILEHETVTKLQVDGKDATTLKLDGDKRYETFQFESLKEIYDAYAQYQAPYDGGVFEGKADFRVAFGDDITEVSVEDQPGYHIEEELINLDDGYYTIDAAYLHAEKEESSAMASYLDDSIFLAVKDGKVEVTITVNDHETVTKLQVDNQDAFEEEVDGQNRYATYELNDLLSVLNGYAQYQAPYDGGVFEGKADFRIALDAESVKSADGSDKPSPGEEDEEVPEEPKADPEEDPKEDPKDPIVEPDLTPDEAYKIDYVIKHEDGVNDSLANDFFTGKATLLVKDGKTYAQMTITSGDMIKELSNKYGAALLVQENEDGSIVVQLRVNNDLSNMDLNMHIIVPEGAIPGFSGYDAKHKTILVFDKDSKEEIDVENQLLIGTEDSKNKNGPLIDEDGTPGKPEFGEGETDEDKNGEDQGMQDKPDDNPQTGDTTNILLYTMLLIGSLIPLAVKLRRRFV